MSKETSKYRFLFIPAFKLPQSSRFLSPHHRMDAPKEKRLRMKYIPTQHLLEDVEWDIHEGALAPYGDWAVENREEFLYISKVQARSRLVKNI